MGRITRLESPPGFISEVTYDDSISPFVLPKDKNVTAYAFKAVKLMMPDPNDATKVLEAVRQLRGEAHPKVQVKNCNLALAHGTGGSLGLRHGSATVILERE